MANNKASGMVRYAVKHGFLPPVKTLKCVDCGEQATDYDHRNYDYPLGVDATCRKCNHARGRAAGTHHKLVPRNPLPKPLNCECHRDVIDALGGIRVLSEQLNGDFRTNYHKVWKWNNRRSIPIAHWHELMEIAQHKNIPLTYKELSDAAE